MGTTTAGRADQLAEQLKAALGAAKDIAAKAETEDRDFTDDERAAIQGKMNEAGNLKKDLEKAKADAKVRSTLAELGDGVEANEGRQKDWRPTGFRSTGGKSLGEHYTESEEYRQLISAVPGGQYTKQHRVLSRPVGYDRLLSSKRGQKALVTGLSDTSGGAFVQNDALGLQVGMSLFQRPLMLRDLVTNGTTTSDVVEYVRITSTTNAAAPVAEATTTSNGTKPESAFATEKVTTSVKTIAHWIPITKRALSDAAQVRTLIDNFLEYGLEEELEDQMIAGDASGENFDGVGHVSGVQAQAWDTDFFTTTRKAKTKVRVTGRSIPTGYVLHPNDLEAMELLQDLEGRYYSGGPFAMVNGVPTLWNIPVIESEAVPAGTGYVGDWRKALLWDREQSSITMSDSHASYFVQNLVAILCELRAAFGVLQPSAFVEIDLTA